MNFKGRVAIVTGGGSVRGFGRTTALMLAERGCDVIITDLNGPGAEETAALCREKGVRAKGIVVDGTDYDQVNAAVASIKEEFGRIDIMINNAGITQKRTILELTMEDWNRMISVDLTSVFIWCQAVLPSMLEQHYGRIVNVSSVAGRNGGGIFGGAHYSAAKAGVIGFSKALGKAYATEGIISNCVAPSACKTDMGMPVEEMPHPE